jgi:gliding motility-associated-like protein
MPADSCKESIANYFIYYSPTSDKTPKLIATLGSNDSEFVHQPDETLAGCYIVGAVDSAGNKNNCTDKICVDVCSYYELPNIFTPNSDNINDLFHPLPYKFVEKVDIKFYNRWGQEVFETTDPDINWNGDDMKTNKPLPEGVYYYIGDVYEKRLTGTFPRSLSGFIQLVRNKQTTQP